MFNKIIRIMWKPLVIGLLVALVVTLSPVGLRFNNPPQDVSSPDLTVGQYQLVLTIGTDVYAAGVADYTCDGVADDVQFQAALDALPNGGGKLVVLSGEYVFANTVARAINNVTIEGVGRASYIANNGATALFSVGVQTDWVFRNLRLDWVSGITLTGSTSWELENVYLGATYYAYRTGTAVTADEWAIPVGRTATYVVAASNSSASSKAQADYVCDGTADNVEIQAAIDALSAGGGKVQLSAGGFSIISAIDTVSGLYLLGMGHSTVITWDGAAPGAGYTGHIIIDTGAPNDVRISSIKFNVNNTANGAICLNGGGSRIRIDHNFITGGKLNQATIYIGSCDQVEIDHNFIDGTNGDLAISPFTCDDVNVHDNIGVNGSAQSFISIGSSSITVAYRNIVSNNIATGWGTGLDIYGNIDDVIISGGYFEGSVNDGIEVHGDGTATYYPKRVTIMGTQVKDCGRYGLHAEMHATEGVLLVDGFRSYNSTNSGIMVETNGELVKISNVIVNVSGGSGISIASITYLELESPTVISAGVHGISIASTVTHAKVLSPFLYANTNSGIRTDVDGTVIVGGQILDNGDNGIDIHGVDYCIVEGVRITDTRAGGSKTQDYGIGEFTGIANCIITGNYVDGNRLGGLDVTKANNTIRNNQGYTASGDVVTISKSIDHAALTDDGVATGRIDFDDAIPVGSIIKAVKCDFTEAFNSDATTTLTMMIGYVGDLDAFNLTVDPGEDAFNHTTDVYWGESDCQAHIVTTAQTPRVTFTEDNDATDIISGGNAQGKVTITITYMKS